jgi:hypothetical protein
VSIDQIIHVEPKLLGLKSIKDGDEQPEPKINSAPREHEGKFFPKSTFKHQASKSIEIRQETLKINQAISDTSSDYKSG